MISTNAPSIPLSDLQIGQYGFIRKLHGRNPMRQRLLDMGLVKDTPVQIVKLAPLGDPIQINVRGYQLAIRKREAELIEVTPFESAEAGDDPRCRKYECSAPSMPACASRRHGRGWRHRMGWMHGAARLTGSASIQVSHTILLAGNPNCGKSTLFNALTGAHQHVGNWPGKTVEKKEGLWVENGTCRRVIDLPGAYSLTAYSIEEIIARDALLDCHADLVIIVLDAANLERNLYLATQILEMGRRALIVLNMWDMALSAGIRIDAAGLSDSLSVPVVAATLSQGAGLVEVKARVLEILGSSGGGEC